MPKILKLTYCPWINMVLCLLTKNKRSPSGLLCFFLAEREGFEPPEPLSSTVFKTAAIDHSAISPKIGCKGTTFF